MNIYKLPQGYFPKLSSSLEAVASNSRLGLCSSSMLATNEVRLGWWAVRLRWCNMIDRREEGSDD